MSKIVQAFMSGAFFTFFLDFFIFLGIKINYIDTNDINEYYNILFADHQNIFIYLIFSIIIGYVTIYRSNKLSIILMTPLAILSFSTLISPIGQQLGEYMFKTSNVTIKTEKFSYTGDILYEARDEIVFFDYRLQKKLNLNKTKIISEQ